MQTNNQPVEPVRWDILPPEKMLVLEQLKKSRYTILSRLTIFEAISITTTAYTATAFKASVLVLTGSALVTGLASVALISYGVYLLIKHENNKDILEKRRAAKLIVEQFSYREIKDNYSDLILQKIVTEDDFNLFYKKELETTNYLDFMRVRSADVVDVLNQDNQLILEQKRNDQREEVIQCIKNYYINKFATQPNYLYVRSHSDTRKEKMYGANLTQSDLVALNLLDADIQEIHAKKKRKAKQQDIENLVLGIIEFSVFISKYPRAPLDSEDTIYQAALKELVKSSECYKPPCLPGFFSSKRNSYTEYLIVWREMVHYLSLCSSQEGKISFGDLTSYMQDRKCSLEILDELIKLSPELKQKIFFDEEHEVEEGTSEGDEEIDIDTLVGPKEKLTDFMEKEGLLGLPKNLDVIFSPLLPCCPAISDLKRKLEIERPKGVLLYGPSGTGKTTFARKLAEYLDCPQQRVTETTGTEVLSKWSGGAQENIRELFAPARENFENAEDDSDLYVIVIDEIDSILVKRDEASQEDRNIVDQLLGEIDGVNPIGNVLVIGTTNSLNRIDPAALRAGRFGIQVEFTLPEDEERQEIFLNYLKPLRTNNFLAEDVNFNQLMNKTEGLSGADIRGIVEEVKTKIVSRHQKAFLRFGVDYEAKLKPTKKVATQADFVSAIDNLKGKERVV